MAQKTMYIVIPVEELEEFSKFYTKQINEKIQKSPEINASGTHVLVGSSRVTESVCEALCEKFPTVEIGDYPTDWVPTEDIV
jgi:hypothetical protein